MLNCSFSPTYFNVRLTESKQGLTGFSVGSLQFSVHSPQSAAWYEAMFIFYNDEKEIAITDCGLQSVD